MNWKTKEQINDPSHRRDRRLRWKRERKEEMERQKRRQKG